MPDAHARGGEHGVRHRRGDAHRAGLPHAGRWLRRIAHDLDLVVRLQEPVPPGRLRDLLSETLNDPSVEIAYPLYPAGGGDNGLSLRAVIPEPNLWSAAAPFRYDGRVEMWVGGARTEVREFAVELRAAS